MSTPLMNEIMAGVEAFPSMPGAAARLMTLLDNPDTPAADLEAVLRYDAGLTANLLKLANSAYFGLRTPIESLHQAVVVLGMDQLRKMVLTSCMNAVLVEPVAGYDLSPGDLWQHSVTVTVTAELLAKALSLPANDSIFTAALLHDVGKLILGQFVGDRMGSIQAAAAGGMSFQEAERSVLGTDHAEVGARILQHWGFPDPLIEAVHLHHDPDPDGTSQLVDLIHVANMLSLMIGIGTGNEGLHYRLSSAAVQRLGVESRILTIVASDTLQWLEEINGIFTTQGAEAQR